MKEFDATLDRLLSEVMDLSMRTQIRMATIYACLTHHTTAFKRKKHYLMIITFWLGTFVLDDVLAAPLIGATTRAARSFVYSAEWCIPPRPRNQVIDRMRVPNSITGVFATAVMLFVSACSKEPPIVAVIPRTTATLLWEPLHLGAAETARDNGLHVYWNAPADEGDPDKQLSLLASCSKRGFRGVIFAPDETFAARSAVLQLVSNQIPVVIVDDDLGPPAGQYLSYVSTDENLGADMAASRVAEILHGRGSIAITGISPRLESGISREASFEKALALRAPNIKIVVRRFGDALVTHQQQLAQDILDSEEPVSAIVALSGTATRGAFFAKLAENPHSTIPVIGFDQDLLMPILSGDVDSIIVQDTRTIGHVAMRNLVAQMKGKSVPGNTKVPPLLLTRQTFTSRKIQSLWEFSKYRWSSQ